MKRITIEGMNCAHCTGRVEKALNKIEGVSAKVDLKGADVTGSAPDVELTKAVESAGFRVVEVKEAQ